jgi:RNA polymerase sigma factor (TIGR02999 family)
MSTDWSARLTATRAGDRGAFSEAFEASYDELRRLARRQLRSLRPGETLATTALVNEAFLKLIRRPVGCQDKTHFFALAARAMRQILWITPRERRAQKRGGDRRRTTLDVDAIPVEAIAEEMIAIDPALT